MNKKRTVGNIFLCASVISLPLFFSLACILGEVEIFGVNGIVRYSWLMGIAIPFDLVTLIIGIILKHHNEKYKIYIVFAVILIPITLIFSTYRLIVGDKISFSESVLFQVEEKINYDLPKNCKVATSYYYEYRLIYAKPQEDAEKEQFTKEISSNENWVSDINSTIYNSMPETVQFNLGQFDYFMFYNFTNEEYNSYPLNDGNYQCILIAYNSQIGNFLILDNFQLIIS